MQSSVVRLSKVRSESKLFRFDAEYFNPKYLKTELLIKEKDYDELRNLISLLTDYHANGSYEILRGNVQLKSEPDYAHMIRTVDIEKDDFENDIISISKHAYKFLGKTKVYGGEIIINKIGNAGKVYLIPPIDRKTSLGMNQFMVRTNDRVNNHYLYCYLAGKYGQNQLNQRITGAVPLSIDKESTRSVLVPIFSSDFEKMVSDKMTIHFQFSKKSKRSFKDAKIILLSELGLTHWQPKHQLTFIKNHSDIKQAERIDAEYYQPKYEGIIKAIQNYSGGWDTLDNFIGSYSTGYPFSSKSYVDDGVCLIRINNILKGHVDLSNAVKIPLQDVVSKKDIVLENDILISMSGTIGNACKIPQGTKAVINQRIFKFTPKHYNFDVLTLIINSNIGLQQLLKIGTGGVQTNISGNDIKKILIPILPEEKQTQIQKKITESFNLRKQSKQLLECAKKAVEIAIEQDEQKAIKWLKEQTRDIGVMDAD
ncbi:MAG: restriction endonuclease subunit S [Deltaproteobacteria bacterium]|jgi:type I restriction enzyme S subunit|nr:restriction endonuclease subunit S [Deltaproteobacteria bacterium]